jgi:hypothetical protein
VLGTGKGQASQQQPDLGSEAAARHQHEPLAARGELVGELHRDAAAERLSDHRGPLVAERGQEVAHEIRVSGDRVLALGSGGVAMAEQIRRDDREASGQRRHDP